MPPRSSRRTSGSSCTDSNREGDPVHQGQPLIELVAILFLGRLIFDIQIAGSFLLLLALAIPFVLAALAMGLFISTVAQNQARALQMTQLTLLPAILLSGYIAPR